MIIVRLGREKHQSASFSDDSFDLFVSHIFIDIHCFRVYPTLEVVFNVASYSYLSLDHGGKQLVQFCRSEYTP